MAGTLFDEEGVPSEVDPELFSEAAGRPTIELDDEARKRRAKTLATISPLVLLEANKSYRGLENYDLQELALAAIELIAVGMTLEGGSSLDDITEGLLPAVAAQRGEADDEEHRRVVATVLETLIEPYRASYADYRRDDYVRRRYEVVLIREAEGPGGIHLRATIEAINAIVGALDTDIESAQHAAEEALRYALEKGRLDVAVQAARQASLRSIQYGEQVRALLDATRRNVSAVDWAETAPRVLKEALEHLATRLENERTLARSLGERRDEAGMSDTVDLAKIATLRRLLDTCVGRHALLRNRLLDAHDVFLEEQERQSFAPVGASYLYDPERELLRPMLEAAYGEITSPLERFFSHAAGIQARPLPRLSTLIPGLLRAPLEHSELGAEIPETEFVIDEEPERFPAELWVWVETLLQTMTGPTQLSELLARARSHSEQAARLLRLRCLHAFGPELGHPADPRAGRLLLADVNGKPLTDSGFGGDDLLVFWAERTATPTATEAEAVEA